MKSCYCQTDHRFTYCRYIKVTDLVLFYGRRRGAYNRPFYKDASYFFFFIKKDENLR